MELTSDTTVIWSWEPVNLNLTNIMTWLVMAILVLLAWLATHRLKLNPPFNRWQNIFEAIVTMIRNHIRDIIGYDVNFYLPFVGTLFLFISMSNLLIIVPGYRPPTGSLSTTVALALWVFISVPLFGIAAIGVKGYLKHYIEPSVIMLPLHVMSELTRTLTLAVRLFGSIMSESMIAAALLSVVPFFVPVVTKAFGLLIGQIQAYIFAVLAAIYIASASSPREHRTRRAADAEEPAAKNAAN